MKRHLYAILIYFSVLLLLYLSVKYRYETEILAAILGCLGLLVVGYISVLELIDFYHDKTITK